MIERGSYRLATDALRRLRDGNPGPRRSRRRSARKPIVGLARAEEIEAHALDYLYGRHGTSVELLGSGARPERAQPRRKRTPQSP
jgi:hypothetical protein